MDAVRRFVSRQTGLGRLAIAAGLSAAATLCAAAPAGADRKPTDHEREGISRVLNKAGFSCDAYPQPSCHRTIKVSTVNERWAAGYIKGGPDVQGAAASLMRKNHRWHVEQLGNGGGCDVPSAVVRDLRLDCF